MVVRGLAGLSDLARALMEWSRLRNRIKLLGYDVKTEYDASGGRHLLAASIVISCDTARDCSKIKEGLDYLFENFEELKDKPLTLLRTK
jgi:hypothetical protein